MIKATLKAIAIGLPVIAATLLVTAPTASADHIGGCPEAKFCAWTEDEFVGGLAWWSENEGDASWLDHGMHDDAESMLNHSRTLNVQTYKDVNWQSSGVCVTPLETYDAGMNDDDYDSHAWFYSCP